MKLAGAAAVCLFLFACGEPEGGLADASPDSDQPFERGATYLTGAHPVAAVVADLDGDGDDDALIPALLTNDIVALRNNGGVLEWLQVGPLVVGASDIAVADVFGDEQLEVIVTNREQNRVDVYTIATGTVDLTHAQTLNVVGASGLATGDATGDGLAEIAVTGFTNDSLTILQRAATGDSLEVGATIATAEGPIVVAIGDVIAGGGNELLVAAGLADVIQIFERRADSWALFGSASTGEWPTAVAITDTAARIVGATTIGDEIFALSADGMSVEPIGRGDGAFAIEPIGLADKPGLAVTNKEASTVSIYEVQASGALMETATLITGEAAGPSPVLAWDFNGDDVDDLLVVNSFTDEAIIYRGVAASDQ